MKFLSFDRSVLMLLIARALSSCGYFALIDLLALLFLESPFHFSAVQIGTLIGLFALIDRSAGLFCASFISVRTTERYHVLGLCISASSLFFLCISHNFYFVLPMMITVGIGNSLQALTTKIWITSLTHDNNRAMAFGWFFRIVNAAAALVSIVVFAIPYAERVLLVIAGIAGCYLLSAIFVLFFCSQAPAADEKISLKIKYNELWSMLQNAFPYCLVFFFAVFFVMQLHIIPFYFKQESSLPSFLGWALALDPLLIVLFQAQATKIFLSLERKGSSLGLIVGFAFFFLAFTIFSAVPSAYKLWLFIPLLACGEMLITPHIDYLLSLRVPQKTLSYAFALTGLMFSGARFVAEGVGILALDSLAKKNMSPNLWWWGNVGILGIVMASMYWVMRRQKIRMYKQALAEAGVSNE